jgi:quercetin dioxygenase-like cupin family protein
MPLAELLEEEHASVSPRVVIQAGTSSERHGNGLQYRVVSGAASKGGLHAVHVTIPSKREHQNFYHHEGEEWLYILSGRLRLIFEDAEHLLEPGDSAHFEARTPHRLAATGPHGAEAVIVLVRLSAAASSTGGSARPGGRRSVPSSPRSRFCRRSARLVSRG